MIKNDLDPHTAPNKTESQTAEEKDILNRYRKLLRHAKPLLKQDDSKIIKKAFNIAMSAHKDMRRKSGEPYIIHPIDVALICVDEIGLGTTSIVAALLHDVVEDTEITLEEIEVSFGKKVAVIIDGLTKISGVFENNTSQQAENFRKMLLTLSQDVRVILIKLADRLHNMRTLASMPRDKQLKIASETIYLYAPLAHRLGLYAIKSELEDLHLKYTEPTTYQQIKEKINASKDARTKFIKKFIHPIQDNLNQEGFKMEIKGRPKSIYSIYTKMKKQDIPFEEIYDLFAIRIILFSDPSREKADCWKVYSIVTDYYQPNPNRLRDWISTPKGNGYESLHTTVMSSSGQWVEVQIRTKRMDEIAEKGYAAHWKYKESMKNNHESGLESWISMVRELLEQNNLNAIEFVDEFRTNLFSDEIFVFTPKGDLFVLPKGATALDFAYHVHSEVGDSCIGAKANNKLIAISHQLRNGDQLEILTSKKQKPKRDWLNHVVSSKAVSHIKQALKEEEKKGAKLGKEILLRRLEKNKTVLDNNVLHKAREYFGASTINELYQWIGTEKINTSHLKKYFTKLKEKEKLKLPVISDQKTFKQQNKKVNNKKGHQESDVIFIGENMDMIDYKLSSCCNPIPGDDVFGFITVNEGIKIHRTSCSNSVELMSRYGYRIVKAEWASKKRSAFLAGIKIIGTDRMSMVNDITNVISQVAKLNIRSITINTDKGIFEGMITLYVNDTKQLRRLKTSLEAVSGVIKVSRNDPMN